MDAFIHISKIIMTEDSCKITPIHQRPENSILHVIEF